MHDRLVQRIHNPEKLAALGTQDTGPRQTKQKTQHRKLLKWATWTSAKTSAKPGAGEGQAVPASYKKPVMLLIWNKWH